MKHLNKPFLLIVFTLMTGQVFAQVCEQPQSSNQFKDIAAIVKALDGKSITLNSSRIRPWSTQAKLPCPPPFKATYKAGKKEISFVAVEHVGGPATSEDTRLKTISTLIEKIKPQGIVLEMATGGVMPPQAFDGFIKGCYQDGKFICGEAAYAAVVAGKNGAEVQGGEPVPPILNEAVLKIEPKTNLLAYRSTQAVLSFKRQGIPKTEWEKKFAEELERNAISRNDIWSFAQYTEWTKKNPKSLPEQVEDNWIEPRNDGSATALQKIAFNVDAAREPLILKTAEQAINKHDKTMIIYGSGHFYKQAPAYEEAFGAPQIECLGQN